MGTILIVEQPSDERTRTRMALQMASHEVVEASSANHAAAIIRSVRPDVALIDDDLPDMRATETVLLLRGIPGYRSLPAVLLMPLMIDEDEEVEADSPTPQVPFVYGIRKPASCGAIEAEVERALAEAGGTLQLETLEKRRQMWDDINVLYDLARDRVR